MFIYEQKIMYIYIYTYTHIHECVYAYIHIHIHIYNIFLCMITLLEDTVGFGYVGKKSGTASR